MTNVKGQLLQDLRERQGLSRDELAQEADLGREAIVSLEVGRRAGTRETWAKLDQLLALGARRRGEPEQPSYVLVFRHPDGAWGRLCHDGGYLAAFQLRGMAETAARLLADLGVVDTAPLPVWRDELDRAFAVAGRPLDGEPEFIDGDQRFHDEMSGREAGERIADLVVGVAHQVLRARRPIEQASSRT